MTIERSLRRTPPSNISGPVSAHIFDVGNTRLFLFGDEHHSFDNLCDPCGAENDCMSIVRFVRGLADEIRASDEHELDVYMEMPYVVRDGPVRRRWLAFLDETMGKDPDNVFPRSRRPSPAWWRRGLGGGGGVGGRGGRAEVVARVLGDDPKYIGIFSQLYREFRDDFYGADSESASRVRFHYCDARHEPHVARILPFIDPARFHRYVRTSDQLRDVLRAFVFSQDFPGDIRRIFGTKEAARVLDADAPKIHKVAKQFHALPEGSGVKVAARRYLEDRIEDAVEVARRDLGFDLGPHILAAAVDAAAAEAKELPYKISVAWLRRYRIAHATYYAAFFPEVIRFSTHLILMDAYLLCRMLRFSFPASASTTKRTAVIYTGDAHSEYYASFFVDYLGVSPSVCSKLGPALDRRTRSTDRCASLAPKPAPCDTLGRMPAKVAPIKTRTRTNAKSKTGI